VPPNVPFATEQLDQTEEGSLLRRGRRKYEPSPVSSGFNRAIEEYKIGQLLFTSDVRYSR